MTFLNLKPFTFLWFGKIAICSLGRYQLTMQKINRSRTILKGELSMSILTRLFGFANTFAETKEQNNSVISNRKTGPSLPLRDQLGTFLPEIEVISFSENNKIRVKPITHAYQNTRVEFPSQLRRILPVGTRFVITAKVCQKHNKDGSKRGNIYFQASDIKIVQSSEENLPKLKNALKQPKVTGVLKR
jgi:hypothetical protein